MVCVTLSNARLHPPQTPSLSQPLSVLLVHASVILKCVPLFVRRCVDHLHFHLIKPAISRDLMERGGLLLGGNLEAQNGQIARVEIHLNYMYDRTLVRAGNLLLNSPAALFANTLFEQTSIKRDLVFCGVGTPARDFGRDEGIVFMFFWDQRREMRSNSFNTGLPRVFKRVDRFVFEHVWRTLRHLLLPGSKRDEVVVLHFTL